MYDKKRIGLVVSLGIAAILVMAAVPVSAATIALEKSERWSGQGKTVVHGVYAADTDGDGDTEIVTVGEVYTGALTGTKAQMKVWSWDPTNQRLTNEATKEWKMPGESIDSTVARSVYIGNVDNSGLNEIVVAGYGVLNDDTFSDYLTIWRYNQLRSDYDKVYETGVDENLMFNSVYAADIDTSDSYYEIVVAGVHFGPVYDSATLHMYTYDGSSWSDEASTFWHPNDKDANASAVYAKDVDSDNVVEILTAGYVHDVWGAQYAEVRVWNYSNSQLYLEDDHTWNANKDSAKALSVFAADVGDGSDIEIITCGNAVSNQYGVYGDLETFTHSGTTISQDRYQTWQYSSGVDTECHSVYAGEVNATDPLDIITVGKTIVSNIDNGQLRMLNYGTGSAIDVEDSVEWYTTNDTEAHSVFVGNVDSDNAVEIVSGGQAYDGTKIWAQLRIWYWS